MSDIFGMFVLAYIAVLGYIIYRNNREVSK